MSLSFLTAKSAMTLISKSAYTGMLESNGISLDDYKKFVGDAPWLPSDRPRMTSILHTFMCAATDVLGLPRFEMSAEYLAAAICFVSGVNVMTACHWGPATGEAELLGQGKESPRVQPKQIHALVVDMYDSPERTWAKQMFEKRIGIELDKANADPSKKGK